MIKPLLVAVSLVACALCAPAARAESVAEAFARVRCEILANIAAQATGEVTFDALQTGPLTGSVPFRIDANTQAVLLAVQATNLFKAGDPSSPHAIVLDHGVPAVVGRVGGDPVPRSLPFMEAALLDGHQGWGTEPIELESGEAGHFSENLLVQCTWVNANNALPSGGYSGLVKITAQVVEEASF
jgi:hypothetical protein